LTGARAKTVSPFLSGSAHPVKLDLDACFLSTDRLTPVIPLAPPHEELLLQLGERGVLSLLELRLARLMLFLAECGVGKRTPLCLASVVACVGGGERATRDVVRSLEATLGVGLRFTRCPSAGALLSSAWDTDAARRRLHELAGHRAPPIVTTRDEAVVSILSRAGAGKSPHKPKAGCLFPTFGKEVGPN
jgi:hypothetical protein